MQCIRWLPIGLIVHSRDVLLQAPAQEDKNKRMLTVLVIRLRPSTLIEARQPAFWRTVPSTFVG